MTDIKKRVSRLEGAVKPEPSGPPALRARILKDGKEIRGRRVIRAYRHWHAGLGEEICRENGCFTNQQVARKSRSS
ncbi:MAG: hypothetical protein WD688_12370 [Candidatus Binatia bacterium]